jgi:hypothetical protein
MNSRLALSLLSFFFLAGPGSVELAAQPTPTGPETRVDTLKGDQFPLCPRIGVAPDQSFEIAWGYDGNLPPEIKARHYNASGSPTDPANGRPRTPETVAVPSAPAFMTFSAALDGAGNLLLLWRPPIQTVLRARLFSATTGAPLGPAYQLDSLGAFACGDVAWAGDSWILAYRTPGDEGHGAIVWRRFTS